MIMNDGVRFALSNNEKQAAFRLRYNIYVESMGRLADKADHASKVLHDEFDKTSRILLAIKDGSPVGTLRLVWGGDAAFKQSLIDTYQMRPFMKQIPENKICIIERLMVSEKSRGSITALRMYKEVMHFVLDQQAELVLLDCEPHRISSYLKLGFRPFGRTYAKPGIGPVIRMALIAGDFEHLQKVSSPFVQLINEDDLQYCRYVSKLKETLVIESNTVNASISSKIASYQHYFNLRKNQLENFSDSRLKVKLGAYA